MKRILITGENSYLGQALAAALLAYPGEYEVNSISLRNTGWESMSFAGYDAIFHAAGIAHSGAKQKTLLMAVNRDLTWRVAEKAKREGVRQFLFPGSIIIYGGAKMGKPLRIDADTAPSPDSLYGQSKLEAEVGLRRLQDDTFRVAVLRLPMVYGPASKGNFPSLIRIARKTPLFPLVDNPRSMLYIDNLTGFLRHLIDTGEGGLFFPQNPEFATTSQTIAALAKGFGRRVRFTRIFNPLLRLLGHFTPLVGKAFGSVCYEAEISRNTFPYMPVSFPDSIVQTIAPQEHS